MQTLNADRFKSNGCQGKKIMMRYIITMAMLLMLSATGMATMWTYDDPMFFQLGTSTPSVSTQPADVSILEILDSPYFPLLGQSFYSNAIPVKLANSTNTVQIGSAGSSLSIAPVTFGGHLEDNLKYAQSKSSLKIGAQGSWDNMNTPGLL
jgi:hypothetical protein